MTSSMILLLLPDLIFDVIAVRKKSLSCKKDSDFFHITADCLEEDAVWRLLEDGKVSACHNW